MVIFPNYERIKKEYLVGEKKDKQYIFKTKSYDSNGSRT